MRAVVLREHGGPEVLQVEDVPDPEPGPEEAVVAVRATAVNRADLLQRMGLYPGPPAALEIPGLELAGTVIGVGERVRAVAVGDHVMGIVGGGGYAERVVVHERQLIPVPAAVPLADAAAIPEVFLTAWDALVVQGGLHLRAESRSSTPARPASARPPSSCARRSAARSRSPARRARPTRAVPSARTGCSSVRRNAWRDDAVAAVPGGFDVVLDVVGGDELDRNLDVVAPQGTIVQVGLMGGAVGPDEPRQAADQAASS